MGWFAKKNNNEKQTSTAIASPTGTATNYVLAKDTFIAPSVTTTTKKEYVATSATASPKKEYTAPSTVASSINSPTQSSVTQTKTLSKLLSEAEEEEMVVVDNPQINNCVTEDGYEDIENPASTSYSRGAESYHNETRDDHRHRESSKQSHLNSLFNGHLMKWKFEAEEGSAFLRVPAFFGALGLMVTAIVAVVLYPEAWEPKSIVMTVCVVIMALFILVLEGRFICPNPLSARAHLRNIVTRNFNILRFVWGRGILYVFAGIINVAQVWLITIVSGAIMIVLGLLSIILGIYASRKFAALRNSLSDESYLLLLFSYYDSDGDGFLEAYQFTNLLTYLGMELDDRYALKAFDTIDRDGDRRISFDEFNDWWTTGYIRRGRKTQPDYDDSS